jgi:NitT/TauT family transport system permease protein
MTAVKSADRDHQGIDPVEVGGMTVAAPRSESSGAVRALQGYGPVALVLAGFVGLWYLLHYVLLGEQKKFLVPPPHQVIGRAYFGPARSELLEGLFNTGRVALIGFVAACALAALFATFMAQSRVLERAFFPYAVVLQTIPILALTPLFIVWFGPTRTARVVTCVLVAIFPILTNFLFGLKSVDQGHLDLFSLHGASRLTRLRKLLFPAALPSIFTGLRIGAGLCVIGALVADFFFTRGDLGLGRLLNNYAKELKYRELFGGVMLAAGLGVAIYALVGWLGNRVLRNWHESERAA